MLVAIRYSRGLDGLDVRAPKSGKKISLARLGRWIVLPAIRSNTCSYGDDNNMNYEAGFRMKNLSNSRALRAAVRSAGLQGVLAASLLTGTLAHGADVQPAVAISVGAPIAFDIPAQSLETALLRFSEQARIQVVVADGAARGAMSSPVRGEFTTAEALQLLLKESGLAYEVTGERTIAIRAEGGSSTLHRTSLSAPAGERETADPLASGARTPDQSTRSEPVTQPPGTTLAIPEVLVHGSRSMNVDIKRTEDDIQPYVVFDREQIERSNAANVEDFLRARLPMNAQQGGAHQGGFAQGVSPAVKRGQLNLRGLGTNQTLILIDGRRIPGVGDAFDTHQADITGIPLAAIERIEVLPSTASGIYGGSATGGVVNIIRKRQYGGVDAQATYENTFDSDAGDVRFDLSGGFTLEEGKTQISFTASHREADGMWVTDRDFASRYRARLLANNPAMVIEGSSPPSGMTPNICAATSGAGTRTCSNDLLLLDNGTSLGDSITHVPVGYRGSSLDEAAALVANAGTYNLDLPRDGQSLIQGLTMDAVSLNLRRSFSSRVEAFIDASASRNRGDMSRGAGNLIAVVDADAPTNPFQQDILVSVPITNIPGPGHTLGKTWSGAAGLIVHLPGSWTAHLEYNRTHSSDEVRTSTSHYDSSAVLGGFRNGTIDALTDPNAFAPDLRSYLYPAPDTFMGPIDMKLERSSVRLAGVPLHLPAGPVAISALVERRDEQVERARFSMPIRDLGMTYAVLYPPKWQSVDSYYVEANAPIVSTAQSIPWIRALELQASVRHDKYRTTGTLDSFQVSDEQTLPPARYFTNRTDSTDFTLGLRYTPLQALVMRASFGTGFLPPTMRQVSQLEDVISGPIFFVDPKRGERALGAEVPVTLVGGGNPDLKPEQSQTWSAGIIFTPELFSGVRLSLDYTRITKSDEIASLDPGYLIASEDSGIFPGSISRGERLAGDPDGWLGPITRVDSSDLNLSSTKVEALDLQFDYEHHSERWGSFRPYLAATHALSFERQILPTDRAFNSVGYGELGSPLEWRGNVGLNWAYNDSWSLDWNAQYYASYKITYADPNRAPQNDLLRRNQGGESVPSQMYHDLSVRYRFQPSTALAGGLLDGLEVRLGVQNLFNEIPPVVASMTFENVGGYSYYGDPRLRRYSLSIKKSL